MLFWSKAHACGNDFLVVDATAVAPRDEATLAVALCERNTGVGADGVEFLTWTGERSGTIRLRNADGSIAEISGNGTRCVAAWMANEKNAAPGETITLETDAGPRTCTLISRDGATMELRTGMGTPQVSAGKVMLDQEGITVEGAVVDTGNPHFVIFVDDETFTVQGRTWQEIGHAICFHPQFPKQTNVEFVQLLSHDEIAIRIFERGVGPTTSSGTGTCATSAAAMTLRNTARTLRVHAPGGAQTTEWLSASAEIQLTGPATIVSKGEAFL